MVTLSEESPLRRSVIYCDWQVMHRNHILVSSGGDFSWTLNEEEEHADNLYIRDSGNAGT